MMEEDDEPDPRDAALLDDDHSDPVEETGTDGGAGSSSFVSIQTTASDRIRGEASNSHRGMLDTCHC